MANGRLFREEVGPVDKFHHGLMIYTKLNFNRKFKWRGFVGILMSFGFEEMSVDEGSSPLCEH